MATSSPLSLYNPIHIQRCYLLPKPPQPIKFFCLKCSQYGATYQNMSKTKWVGREVLLLSVRMRKGGTLWGEKEKEREKRVVKVRFNQGLGFNGGEGGGGGGGGGSRDDRTSARALGNLALVVGLACLFMTDQFGWILDTIVNLWLLVFFMLIVGSGVFLWWAGRDMIQGTCPNCANAFQAFKSTLNDELQLCPFCSQPFSVEGNEFVKEPIKFSSKRSTAFGQKFKDFSPWSKKGKDVATTVVDVEAEVRDAE